MRRVFVAVLEAVACVIAVVIFFSRAETEVGLGERESERRSRKWKQGVRETSMPYLAISTTACPGPRWRLLSPVCSTYRCSSKFVFPKGKIAHPTDQQDGGAT